MSDQFPEASLMNDDEKRETVIGEAAARKIADHLDRIETIVASEIGTELPEALRRRVMVLGCSTRDINFWIRRDDPVDDGQTYKLTEGQASAQDTGGATDV